MAQSSMTSPLADLLKQSKPDHAKLIASRQYEEASTLRQQCFDDAAFVKEQMHADVAERHTAERRRLRKSKDMALKQVHARVQSELDGIQDHWSVKKGERDARQAARYEDFERALRAKEATKPLVLSSYVRDLQQSETRLADFHMYAESSMVRRKISKREVVERGEAEAAREKRIQRGLAARRSVMVNDDSNFRAKVKSELHIAVFRAGNEEDRVHRKFGHVNHDMDHAHSLELRSNPLMSVYQRPKFLGLQQRATVASASDRGTDYLRRTQGSKFAVPSLCDMYADGIPTEVKQTGAYVKRAATTRPNVGGGGGGLEKLPTPKAGYGKRTVVA
jgi:hypothetical protein